MRRLIAVFLLSVIAFSASAQSFHRISCGSIMQAFREPAVIPPYNLQALEKNLGRGSRTPFTQKVYQWNVRGNQFSGIVVNGNLEGIRYSYHPNYHPDADKVRALVNEDNHLTLNHVRLLLGQGATRNETLYRYTWTCGSNSFSVATEQNNAIVGYEEKTNCDRSGACDTVRVYYDPASTLEALRDRPKEMQTIPSHQVAATEAAIRRSLPSIQAYYQALQQCKAGTYRILTPEPGLTEYKDYKIYGMRYNRCAVDVPVLDSNSVYRCHFTRKALADITSESNMTELLREGQYADILASEAKYFADQCVKL